MGRRCGYDARTAQERGEGPRNLPITARTDPAAVAALLAAQRETWAPGGSTGHQLVAQAYAGLSHQPGYRGGVVPVGSRASPRDATRMGTIARADAASSGPPASARRCIGRSVSGE